MMIFGAAILIRNGEVIHESIKRKMTNAVYLTKIITKKNGNIVQIGDNDSGRLVNSIMYGSFMNNEIAENCYGNLKGYSDIYGKEEEYFDENILCHNSMINYFNGLFRCKVLRDLNNGNSFESSFINAIANKEQEKMELKYNYQLEINKSEYEERFSFKKNNIFDYKSDIEEEKIQWGYFDEFGIYYYKNSTIDFYLYTGGEKGGVRIGHSHNDILHCELNIAGEDILIDKGTYVYTALTKERDLFRSIKSHFVPDYGHEQRDMRGTFGYFSSNEKVIMLEVNENRVKLRYVTDMIEHQRDIVIEKDKIIIIDEGNAEFKLLQQNRGYSNGYGKIIISES